MPKLSCSTFAIGARQFVVQDALLMTVICGVMTSWFTPYTTVASTPSAGAEISTLRAPAPSISALADSLLVKRPVHSSATSTPWYGTFDGSRSADTLIGPKVLPRHWIVMASPSTVTSPGKRPCTLS